MQSIEIYIKCQKLLSVSYSCREKFLPLLLCKLLRIILLLPIFIFIPLALWYYLFLVQSTVKVFTVCLANVLFWPFAYG